MQNLTCKRIQCDEIWQFCYAKDKNVPDEMRGTFGYGDVWTWVAIDPDTKLVVSHTLGTRGAQTAKRFIDDLDSRLANRVQLTTDGHRVYLQAYALVVEINHLPRGNHQIPFDKRKLLRGPILSNICA